MAMALKFMPADTLSSFSYSTQLFRSTHDAIMDDRSADEKDDRSPAQKDVACAVPKSSLSFTMQLGVWLGIAPLPCEHKNVGHCVRVKL